VNPAEYDRGGQATEKPSVGDDAALPPREDFKNVIEFTKIGHDEEQPRADNGADERPHRATIS
jgi:hypothetical protein